MTGNTRRRHQTEAKGTDPTIHLSFSRVDGYTSDVQRSETNECKTIVESERTNGESLTTKEREYQIRFPYDRSVKVSLAFISLCARRLAEPSSRASRCFLFLFELW